MQALATYVAFSQTLVLDSVCADELKSANFQKTNVAKT